MIKILTYIVVSIVILAICAVAMAVGVILRKKPLKSCACGDITVGGERIRCPACPDRETESSATESETSPAAHK